MGWLLGCFKCRQRRPTGNSISRTASCKDGCTVPSAVTLLSTHSAQAKESSEMDRILSIEVDELKRNSSACIKTDKRSRSARRPLSEQLSQVEKIEEEIDSLNKKLAEEATQATILTNEVRHLRKCSALLDSPTAFRKALNALEQTLEKGCVEESQPLLYLHSLLSKIEPSEELVETSSEERDEERQTKGLSKCSDNSSLMAEKDCKSLEKANGKASQVEPQHSEGDILTSATIARDLEEGQRHMLKNEQNMCSSRPQHLSDGVDAKKTQQISVVRRRSSTTLSFSGFILLEDVTEERPTSDKAAGVEQFRRTEFAVTKIIERTNLSGENLVEASKSMFAFSTDSPQGHSTSTGQAHLGNISKDLSLSNSDSEADSCSGKPEGNGGCFNLWQRSPRCLWSPQDEKTYELDGVCGNLSSKQCQIDANEDSCKWISEADELSLSSTLCSKSVEYVNSSSIDSEESDPLNGTKASISQVLTQMDVPSVKDKVSTKRNVNSHATVQALGMPQPGYMGNAAARSCCDASCASFTKVQAGSLTRSMDKLIYANSVEPLEACTPQEAGFEAKHCFRSSLSEGQTRNESLGKTNQDEAIFFENLMHSSLNEPSLKVSDKFTSIEEDTLCRTSPCSSVGDCSILGGEAVVELSSPGTTSIWSRDTLMSTYAVQSPLPLLPTNSFQGGPSGCLPETPSTPASVNYPQELRLHLTKADASKLNFIPLRTPSASLTQAETPSTTHSPGSPSSPGEDRPVLGTVAAHWNPSSSALSTQQWWDGKGIPNSTNKYKEDQKVSWHATPFEVRLERALAKQGRVFQKKLFTGAMATEMEVTR